MGELQEIIKHLKENLGCEKVTVMRFFENEPKKIGMYVYFIKEKNGYILTNENTTELEPTSK